MGNADFDASALKPIFEPIWNRTGWIETVGLIDDATNETITDLADCTARIEIRSGDRCDLPMIADDGIGSQRTESAAPRQISPEGKPHGRILE